MDKSDYKTNSAGRNQAHLLSPLNVWALSLGCAVGWGAFMVPANLFIPTAGPLGTMIAMAISTALLLVIGANFCRLSEKYHDDGGIVAYTRNILGHDHAFLVAWILIIAYLSILWVNVTANILLIRFLFGDVLSWEYLYTIAGFDVYLGELIATWIIILAFGLISCYGGRFVKKINPLFAITLLLTVIILFAGLFIHTGTDVFTPSFQLYTSPIMQVFSMVMLAPWMFFGFEAVTHACDDFQFSSKKLFPIVVAAVLSGGLIYILLAAMAVMSIPPEYPSWTSYMASRPSLEGLASLPVFHSVYAIFGMNGLALLCLSIASAIITSLFGLYRTTGRLLLFMGRADILPPWFTRQADDETPRNAIIFVMLISLFIPLLGRISLVWLSDILTVAGSVAYGYVSLCAYLTAKKEDNLQGKILGVIGVLISALFFFCPLLPDLLLDGNLETESYLMLSLWSLLGFIYYWYCFKHDTHDRFGHSTSMCIIILFLNFFSTSIWLRLMAEQRLKESLSNDNAFAYQSLINDSMVQIGMIMVILLLMANIFITLKRRERKTTQSRLQQYEVNQAQNTYLANLAHDIRIPMEAVQTSVHMALENCTICTVCPEENCPSQIPDRLNDCLGKLDAHNQHLMSMIDNMLHNPANAQPDAACTPTNADDDNRIQLHMDTFDWRQILQEIKDLFVVQMQEKNIFFEVYPINLPHPLVCGDVQRLERILLNLISNAWEYTPKDGGVMVTLLETPVSPDKATYELHIQDSGSNMPPAIVQHLSQPFDPEITNLGGLHITKGLVNLMGGTMKISTIPGQGMGKELIIQLPLTIAAENNTATIASKQEGEKL
ncbi:MAG: amino acid permease [Selenomonas sp.]|uniref:amino acid permease n=1 Tax=Selenomonas sp. TaxID=2053611 RepID=UPI0025FC6D85|nr:amino acid permease [Selenomonas sp.]MCR5756573.1 amino acid permease [Selenomonas sp.]